MSDIKPIAWARTLFSPDCGDYVEFHTEKEMGVWRDRKDYEPLYPQSAIDAQAAEIARLRAALQEGVYLVGTWERDAVASDYYKDIAALREHAREVKL